MNQRVEKFDIVIVGGGLAGLCATAAFATTGVDVLCIDPAPPVTDAKAKGADLRTTAILQPGQALLARIGLWPHLKDHASDLQVMRIVDAGGQDIAPRLSCDFDSTDIGEAPFGWNLPNWLIRRQILTHLDTLPNVTLRFGTSLKDLTARETEARARLSDGAMISARLVIGADGRNSSVRASLGISARTTRFDQKALVFAVTHPEPHRQVSTEIHRSGGPFTLVPLPDQNGMPCSAVVWMERNAEAERLCHLDEAAFNQAATQRACALFGPLTLASPRSLWPMIAQVADRFTGPRVALMAEAAHVVPPIGAQGLNMSLADIACLLDLVEANPETLGDGVMMRTYDKARRPEVTARVTGIQWLNRMSMVEAQPLRDLRKTGLGLIYGLSPVRKIMMQMGLGARGQ